MYRAEVPQYGTLMELVAEVNAAPCSDPAAASGCPEASWPGWTSSVMARSGSARAGELNTIRRIFAVMGMYPVGYYDLSVAGVPVHSTAFRPVDEAALRRNPFRVFTSLLRLELIEDAAARRGRSDTGEAPDLHAARAEADRAATSHRAD